MALNVDHAQNIYRQALERFALTYASIDDTQKDELYRETISILDYLIADLSYTTHMVKYGEYPGDLNGLTFVLDVAWWLRGDVWHRFLKVGNGNYKEDYLSSEAWRRKREQVIL